MVERQLGGTVAIAAAVLALVSPVQAAPCGNSPAGFESWKQVFGQEAAARGIKPKAISALMRHLFDRHHQGRPGPEELQAVARLPSWPSAGPPTIVARGKRMKTCQCGALCRDREALRRAARAAARHLGDGDRIRQLHRQAEHAVGRGDARL